ncbi:hypothetical protein Nepgr_024999 [Nepenthes gracilis]|uniref:TLD domain-containing protein 1 n=1 Tax=Nepenthes gracilis TaxID=150966 RepID=A0AAD3T5W4_NEPGR|nr:hypothetical protein Nepgr_024999 [Nepenthes gracilis]
MGNSQSSSTLDTHVASAMRAFTQQELEELRSLFSSLAAQSKSNGQFISRSVFTTYFRIPVSLGERMFDLVTQKRNDQKITFEDLVVAKATYEKGTKDDMEEFIYQLVDVNGDGTLGRSDLEAVLVGILESLFSQNDHTPGSGSNKYFIDALLNAATYSKCGLGSEEKSMSLQDFNNWCALVLSVRKYLGGLLMQPDPGRFGSQVPHLLFPESYATNIILREEYAWFIGGSLSQQELEAWELLYHSYYNGLSFNTFLGSMLNDEGPTLIIINDKEGCIYGGYASHPWERRSDFYGDMKSFLFQLHPKASIFRPTGANSNLQWCAMNYSSEAIPNGIGFGGRVHHFGLFLSASFDHGHSFACSTFGSPCLSASNQIFPEVIECWTVRPKGVQQLRIDAARGTVLERFKEDRHMLNMVGIANSSS